MTRQASLLFIKTAIISFGLSGSAFAVTGYGAAGACVNANSKITCTFPAVPSGKVLTVKYISYACFDAGFSTPTQTQALGETFYTIPPNSITAVAYYLKTFNTGMPTQPLLSGNIGAQGQFYAKAGSAPQLLIDYGPAATTIGSCNASIAGETTP